MSHPCTAEFIILVFILFSDREVPSNGIETADVVKVGNFILSKGLHCCFSLTKFECYFDYFCIVGLVDKINNFHTFTGHIRPQSYNIKLHGGLYYHTEDIWNPQVFLNFFIFFKQTCKSIVVFHPNIILLHMRY